MKTKENNITLQLIRGLAIILVLIHHSIVNVNVSSIGTNIDNIIICFHMPIFFLISGYLFELKIKKYIEDGKLHFIKKKFKYLILPYIFWTIFLWCGVQIACLVNLTFMKKIGFEPMSALNLIKGIFTYEIYYTQHLWFLYVLFLIFIFNIMISKANKKIILIFSIIIGIIFSLIKAPNIINRLLIWFPFFIIGRNINNVKIKKIIDNKKINISCISLFIVLSIVRINILDSNEVYMKVINRIILYLIGIIGSYLLYSISCNIKLDKIKKILSKIGDYSYQIYLIHNPYFVALSSIVLSSIFKISSPICIITSVLIGIVMSMIISIMIKKYLKKISIYILGK